MSRSDAAEYNSFFSTTPAERRLKKQGYEGFLRYFQRSRAIADLGCGDGVFLELISERLPHIRRTGVETSSEFVALCNGALQGTRIVQEDALSFMRREHGAYDTFIMSDMVEHLDFAVNLEIFSLVPPAGIMFIKTPNINSLLGHQFYLQVPGHKAPYSPYVLKRMFERAGLGVRHEGECDGVLIPSTLLGRIRNRMLRLLFMNEYPRMFGGGNYFVVAEKIC